MTTNDVQTPNRRRQSGPQSSSGWRSPGSPVALMSSNALYQRQKPAADVLPATGGEPEGPGAADAVQARQLELEIKNLMMGLGQL
ncbi:hypothetical protein ACRRTK_006660 [Alexandromys fortis]